MDTVGLPTSVDCANRLKTVAIVGASGYIGKRIVEELRRLGGYKIKLLARSLDQNLMAASLDAGVEVFKGDLGEPALAHYGSLFRVTNIAIFYAMYALFFINVIADKENKLKIS